MVRKEISNIYNITIADDQNDGIVWLCFQDNQIYSFVHVYAICHLLTRFKFIVSARHIVKCSISENDKGLMLRIFFAVINIPNCAKHRSHMDKQHILFVLLAHLNLVN